VKFLATDKEETYQIKNQEQADLLTDPIGLTILVAMEKGEWISAEKIAQEIDEDKNMVLDYLLRMSEAEMVISKKTDQNILFNKKAQYYSLGQIFNDIPQNVDNHWVFGLIQHLSSDFKDLLELLKDYDDIDKALEDNQYFGKKSLFLGIQKIYLDQEDLENFREEINAVISKYRDKSRQNEDTREFETALFTKPYLPAIYKIKEQQQKNS